MKLTIIAAFAILLVPVVVPAQGRTQKAQLLREKWERSRTYWVSLQEDLVEATQDYIASLERLRPLLQRDVERAAARGEQARAMYDQGLIQLEEFKTSQRTVREREKKVTDVESQIEAGKKKLAEAERDLNILKNAQRPSDKELLRWYRQEAQEARAEQESRCSYWTVTTEKKSTNYKICQRFPN